MEIIFISAKLLLLLSQRPASERLMHFVAINVKKTASNASTGAVLTKVPPCGRRLKLPIIAAKTTPIVKTG